MIEIYFDNNLINGEYCADLSTNYELFSESFKLGSTAGKIFELSIEKEGVQVQPSIVTIKEDGNDIAILQVDDIKEEDYIYKYTLTDKMVDLEFYYDASKIFVGDATTLYDIAQDICNKAGLILGTTDFRSANKEISWSDNTRTAREYIGYIAELNGGFARIENNILYFIKQNTPSKNTISIDYCENFIIGERHLITRVVYELGTLKYEYGNEDGNTLYLNPENVFITEAEEVEAIYNELNNFEFYSFETSNCPIDFNIKAGDIVTFTDNEKNYPTIVNYNLSYFGQWYGGYKLDINTERQEETKVIGEKEKLRNLRIIVDRDRNLIEQAIEEIGDRTQKSTSITQDIDTIQSQIKNIAEYTKEVTHFNELHLDETVEGTGYILNLKIKGNSSIFKYLVPSQRLVPQETLVPNGDEFITIICDKNSRSQPTEDATIFKLHIGETLKNINSIHDELIIDTKNAKIIRRIGVNENGEEYILPEEFIQDLGEISIPTFDDNTYVYIENYLNVEYYCKYILKSDFSEIYATKVETSSSITQTSEEIMLEVNRKIDEEELGTQIIQNYESVRIAWNNLSEYIQFKNAELQILDENEDLLMSLNKTGQDFYDDNQVFGEMGVEVETTQGKEGEETNRYIAFSVDGDYDTTIENGMAWGLKTKSDGRFFPVFYIKNFYMPPKGTGYAMGDLVLSSGRFILDSVNAALDVGAIEISGDEISGVSFSSLRDKTTLLHITPEYSVGTYTQYASIRILDKIEFFKNQLGTNSLKLGSSNTFGNFCLFTDDGDIQCGEISVKNEINAYDATLWIKEIHATDRIYTSGNITCKKLTETSLAESKKNIELYQANAIEKILNTDIYEFNYDTDLENEKKTIGTIIGEGYKCDEDIISNERNGINLYSMISIAYKAIQEQQEIIDNLKEKITKIGGE